MYDMSHSNVAHWGAPTPVEDGSYIVGFIKSKNRQFYSNITEIFS